MSRTDKTAPWRVKAFYYPSWVEEYHDHRDGVCNLPPQATQENLDWIPGRGKCGWVWSMEMVRHPLQQCNCKLCRRWGWDLKNTPRGKRRAARRYCRDGWRDEY